MGKVMVHKRSKSKKVVKTAPPRWGSTVPYNPVGTEKEYSERLRDYKGPRHS